MNRDQRSYRNKRNKAKENHKDIASANQLRDYY